MSADTFDYPTMARALIVGDRLDTDIAMGRRVGLWTALVLTGVSSRREAEDAPPTQRPHWILEGLQELPELLTKEALSARG